MCSRHTSKLKPNLTTIINHPLFGLVERPVITTYNFNPKISGLKTGLTIVINGCYPVMFIKIATSF
jgi:hypothetical protein